MREKNRDFVGFFCPQSIAIVGASTGEYRFGGTSFLRKLQECGFPGRLYPVNPKAREVSGVKAYPDLPSLPEVPDLAMVSVPARYVPSVLEQCAAMGLTHVHILTSGFKELGTEKGVALEREVERISREAGLLVMGPNCMGPYCPGSGLTPWGAIPGMNGPLGVVSQSGVLTQRLTEYAASLGVGVHKAVSFGNGAVLDATDFLDFMAGEEEVRVIVMYLESASDVRRLLDTAGKVSREKPVIFWKGGQTDVGAATAASHTGSICGDQVLWEGFYRQTGVVPVRSLTECVDTMTAFCLLPRPGGKGVFLIGGGGGNSVVSSDTCIREGLDVPRLSGSTMGRLRQSTPQAGSIPGNPLDMARVFQDATCLNEILDLAHEDPHVSMIVVDRFIPRKAYHLKDLPDSTPAVIEGMRARGAKKPTAFTVDSDGGDPELAREGALLRSRFSKAGFPAYPSLARAARALAHLYRYTAWREKEVTRTGPPKA